MSTIKQVEKLLKELRKQLRKVDKAARTVNSVNGSIRTNLLEVQELSTIFSTFLNQDSIDLPNTVSGIQSFVSKINELMAEFKETVGASQAKDIVDMMLLSNNKSDFDLAHNFVANTWGDGRIVDLTSRSTNANLAMGTIISTENARQINRNETRSRQLQIAGLVNGESTLEKYKSAAVQLLSLTPASSITTGNTCTVAKPIEWNLGPDANIIYDFASPDGAFIPSSGLGVANSPDSESTVDYTGNVSLLEFEDPYTSVSGNGFIVFSVDSEEHDAFPPKQEVYTWKTNIELHFIIEGDGVTPLKTLANSDIMLIDFYVKKFSTSSTSKITKRILLRDGIQTNGFMNIVAPYTGGAYIIDAVIRTDDVFPCSLTMQFRGAGLYGSPKSDSCPANLVDYVMNGTRHYLNGTERWEDLFGKLDSDPNKDPNFSLEQLWNDRSHMDEVRFSEFVQSLVNYSDTTWGPETVDNNVSISYKYRLVNPNITDLRQVAKTNTWIYLDGPLGGINLSRKKEIIKYLYEDIEFVVTAMEMSPAFASSIVEHNATSANTITQF
jgi:hypothetical protein